MLAQSVPAPNSWNIPPASAFSSCDLPVRDDPAVTKSGGEWRKPVPAALVLGMECMAKYSGYNAPKTRRGATVLRGPVELFIFMAGLFGSVALLLIALLMHI
jgi:hypothetical protein